MSEQEKIGTFYVVDGELVHETDMPKPETTESKAKPIKSATEKPEPAQE